MNTIKVVAFIFVISSISYAKGVVLSPENFSAASLKVVFEKSIKLNQKNKFRHPIWIDSHNRCSLSSTKEVTISSATEWKSESKTEWNDWDLKSFNFKLVNQSKEVSLNCELNLLGEIVLFNVDAKRLATSECLSQGGKMQNTPPKLYTSVKNVNNSRLPASALPKQAYCVKRVPKVTTQVFKTAFAKSKIDIQIDFANEAAL